MFSGVRVSLEATVYSLYKKFVPWFNAVLFQIKEGSTRMSLLMVDVSCLLDLLEVDFLKPQVKPFMQYEV